MKLHIEKMNGSDRTISYRRIGNGTRKAIFFHGFPGSCAQVAMFSPIVESNDLEVLSLDRPGYGNTSEAPLHHDQIATTLSDSKNLMQHLGWKTCEVIGVSGGTPFALSFSQSYPEFVSQTHIISGLGPLAHRGFGKLPNAKARLALKLLPLVPGVVLDRAISSLKNSNTTERPQVLKFFLPLSKPDQDVMHDTEIRAALKMAILEAFLTKGEGPKNDARSYLSPWGWELEKFRGGKVTFWHGDSDLVIPSEMSVLMSSLIPSAVLNIVPGEGHYSLAARRTGMMLAKT